MSGKYDFDDLDNHFTLPKRFGKQPFYGQCRIPRKLKKKIKNYVGIHWNGLNNGQRIWHYMEKSNPDYKRFLIKNIQ